MKTRPFTTAGAKRAYKRHVAPSCRLRKYLRSFCALRFNAGRVCSLTRARERTRTHIYIFYNIQRGKWRAIVRDEVTKIIKSYSPSRTDDRAHRTDSPSRRGDDRCAIVFEIKSRERVSLAGRLGSIHRGHLPTRIRPATIFALHSWLVELFNTINRSAIELEAVFLSCPL